MTRLPNDPELLAHMLGFPPKRKRRTSALWVLLGALIYIVAFGCMVKANLNSTAEDKARATAQLEGK